MVDLLKMLEELATKLKIENEDKTNWIQVGKLVPEDLAKIKNLRARANEREREAKLCLDKLKALKANTDLDSSEWWLHVHKAYGLTGANYSIDEDDGRILMEPKKT